MSGIRWLIYFLIVIAAGDSTYSQQDPGSLPLTIAESSDFKATSTSAQVVEFLDQCAASARHVTRFVFGKSVEGREMVGVTISSEPYQPGQNLPEGKVVALVIGNIHSGECAGKEALLMMVRDLAASHDHPWLKNMVLIIAPNYNTDANDRVGKNNRPGQIGPENGMGRRENAQDLDLNRDFIKLESPEARALIKLIDKTNPHLFIDCHTTNGSKHQYALTYDIPHNPATAEPIRNFLRQKMMPAVTKRLASDGTLTYYYGNFNSEHTSWTTYGHEPRYSTEYVGLRGRLAILSEAYSYISYKDRIFASKKFVSTCLEYIHKNADTVTQLLKSVDEDLVRIASQQPSRITVSLNAKATKFEQKCTLKGYKDDKPHDYECDFVGDYVSTRSTPLPFAYLIPRKFARQVDRLLMHGISVEQLVENTEVLTTFDTIKDLNRNERAFQKHKMVQAQSQRATEKRTAAKGTYLVRTSQPLGRLAAYMLECESDDGLLFWNFFDNDIAADKEYPVQRIDSEVALNSEKVSRVEKTTKVSLDIIGGENSILTAQSAPRWVNGNQIELELYDRKFLMDADSMSFSTKLDPLFDKQELAALLIEKGVEKELADSLVEKEPIESDDRTAMVFDNDKRDFLYLPESRTIAFLGDESNNAEIFTFSPDKKKLAYVNNKGLNIRDIESDKTVNVLSEKAEFLVGKLDWVYQEELYGRGNFKGYWWSPDSKRVAFLKLDESDVQSYTITDHIPVRGEDEFLKYPKAGDPNPTVEIGIADAGQQDVVTWVDLSRYDEEEILVTNVAWRPDSQQLFVQIQNRVQTYLDLVAVSSASRNPVVLFRDKTPAWIESPGEPKWLDDNSFLWLSPRSGYRHIYHYNADGNQRLQLTSGDWEVRSLLEFDKKNEVAYFTAAKENAHDVDGYRIALSDGKIQRLTNTSGTHQLSFNENNTLYIDSASTATGPAVHTLCRSDGTFLRRLSAGSDDRWNYIGICEPEYLTVPSGNKQPMDAMIIRPPDFDPTKKYPVLIHTYAGPQAPQVRNRFGRSWFLWHQALAAEGYIIWKCDNQSASYRSTKNVWPIHEDLGRNELADIEKGVAWLKQQPWVDSERIGIWGWSYGGYMTAYALTHSQSFKIGISGAPVTDWRNYDTIYTERLMGLPSENKVGYDSSSVVQAAGNLSGKLLLIHGSIDDNVHLSNSMQFALELQKAGKPFDLMIYPKNRHAIRAEEQAQHLRRLMFDYVVKNL